MAPHPRVGKMEYNAATLENLRMPTWQFQTHVNPNQTLTIPPEVANQLETESVIRVVLMTSGPEDAGWDRLTVEQFVEGYAPGDDIYDQLSQG